MTQLHVIMLASRMGRIPSVIIAFKTIRILAISLPTDVPKDFKASTMSWVTDEGPLTGKCLCGKLSYTIAGRPQLDGDTIHCTFCHCTMCQRVSGSPMMTFVGWNTSEVTWACSPTEYQSSPEAKRLFCG